MVLRAAGVCSGIGAFEYAAHLAGLQVVGACDIDPQAVHWHRAAQQRFARPPYPVYEADILAVPELPPCEVGLAGLPCQPFSQERSGGRRRGMADSRGAPLWEATARVFARAGARVVVVENVDGAAAEAVQAGRAIFAAHGFPYVHYHLLRAADYGSVQVRRRLWLTFSREPLQWQPAGPAPGPRPLEAFLLKPDDFRAEPDDGWDCTRLREALEPCYLGGGTCGG